MFMVIRRPPSACEDDSDNTNNINIIRSWGEFEGGDPYPRLSPTPRAPKAADGRGRPSDTGPVSKKPHTKR